MHRNLHRHIVCGLRARQKKFQMNGKMVVAGAISCTVKFISKQQKNFKNLLVFFNGMPHTHGWLSNFLIRHFVLLFCAHGETQAKVFQSFRMAFSSSTTSLVSPTTSTMKSRSGLFPSHPQFSASALGRRPQGLKNECRKVVNKIYGKEAREFEIESYRMCW